MLLLIEIWLHYQGKESIVEEYQHFILLCTAKLFVAVIEMKINSSFSASANYLQLLSRRLVLISFFYMSDFEISIFNTTI